MKRTSSQKISHFMSPMLVCRVTACGSREAVRGRCRGLAADKRLCCSAPWLRAAIEPALLPLLIVHPLQLLSGLGPPCLSGCDHKPMTPLCLQHRC